MIEPSTLLTGTDSVRYGNVGTVEYRDSIAGIRYTAHYSPINGFGWIVRHEPTERNDTDGLATHWSGPIPGGWDGMNAAWNALRASLAA